MVENAYHWRAFSTGIFIHVFGLGIFAEGIFGSVLRWFNSDGCWHTISRDHILVLGIRIRFLSSSFAFNVGRVLVLFSAFDASVILSFSPC